MDKGYIEKFTIQNIKTEEKIKEPYTEYEMNLLLKKPDLKRCSFSEYRNWVLVNYFYSTGNRLNTVRNIKIEDLNLKEKYVYLRVVKTRRQQIIPLSNTMIAILTEYLRYRKGEPNDYLFPTIQNKQMSSRGLETAITGYNLKRGVTKTSIHLFRHTFARDWILAGGDEFTLQNLLGHSTSDMTKHYVNIYGKDLRNSQFYKLNPLDRRSSVNTNISMKNNKK